MTKHYNYVTRFRHVSDINCLSMLMCNEVLQLICLQCSFWGGPFVELFVVCTTTLICPFVSD